MKILYLRTVFWFNLKSGGSVGHTAGVINALKDQVKLNVKSNDKLEGVKNKVEIILPGLLKYIPLRFGELLYNYKVIRTISSDIDNINCIYQRYSGLTFSGIYIAKNNKIPIILEYNSSDVWKLQNWSVQGNTIQTLAARAINLIKLPIVKYIEKYNLKNANIIIVVSQALKESLIKIGIPEKKILVNYNGVDPEKYNPSISGKEVRVRYNLQKYNVIGFIGTFGQWHGVVEMAKAIDLFYRLYPTRNNDVKFLLVGDGRLMPEVKKILNASEFKKNVVITGLIPQQEGPKYLAACDVLLSPHIKNPDGTKFFGSPTKLFEYMAMGKPIIASNLDQIGDILSHEETALLVKPGNSKELAVAIHELLDNSQLRKKIGTKARKEVIRKYTWDINVQNMLQKLKELK